MAKHTEEVDGAADPLPARSASSGWWRWLALAALVLALCAIGIGIWVLLRPPQPAHAISASAGSTKTADEAKAQVCKAFDTVRRSVSLRTNADLGPDPVAIAARDANARLAISAGGSYLLDRIDSATPSPLAAEVRSFALNLQDIGMNMLAGVPSDEPAQAARLRDGEDSSKRIAEMCK